jgi:allophanate hydrolase subunit 2
MDPFAFRVGNSVVGNAEAAAGIEATLQVRHRQTTRPQTA